MSTKGQETLLALKKDIERHIERDREVGRNTLLQRLAVGQEWLLDAWRLVRELPGAPQELGLLAGIARWCELEELVRFVYGFEGCVIGDAGCAADAPVRCRACSAKEQKGHDG